GLDTTGLVRVAGDDDVGGFGVGAAIQGFQWRSMHGKRSPDIRPPRCSRVSGPHLAHGPKSPARCASSFAVALPGPRTGETAAELTRVRSARQDALQASTQ